MSERRQIVVLEVVYDPDDDPTMISKSPPAEWDWQELTGEQVVVLAAGPEQIVDPS
jgi:hypothetical protein